MSDPGPAVPTATIGAADLRVLVEGGAPSLWVLDTRPRAEYEAGHVPGALHCEVHELSKREKELPPRLATVVVVGGSSNAQWSSFQGRTLDARFRNAPTDPATVSIDRWR